jgi:hypothetical protein
MIQDLVLENPQVPDVDARVTVGIAGQMALEMHRKGPGKHDGEQDVGTDGRDVGSPASPMNDDGVRSDRVRHEVGWGLHGRHSLADTVEHVNRFSSASHAVASLDQRVYFVGRTRHQPRCYKDAGGPRV